ncbi:MAG TPA: PAS domain S-box protein [Bacteroidota bacterium]|nr:PAS domain S-box protein [Bacteroidota bacterium]
MTQTLLFRHTAIDGPAGEFDEVDLLHATHEELAFRLLERSSELETANEELHVEISERMRAEEELERSNMFLRSILDSSSSISIISSDQEGMITYWNIGAQKLFGYKASEVVGRENIRILTPIDEPWTAATLTMMRTSALTTQQSHRREVIECTKSGEKVWINLAVSPRLDENGECIGTLALGENITARKIAERELFTTRGRLEQLLDTSLVIIYSRKVSEDFGITFISNNVGALLGCDPADFTDDAGYWASCLHPDDKPRVTAAITRIGEDHQVMEYRFRYEPEQYRWLRDEMRLVRDDLGEPLEIVGSWVDITDEKNMERALRESEEKFRALAEFSQDIIMRFDKNLRHLYVNPMAERQMGVPVEAFFGKTPRELDFPSELVEFWEREIRKTFETKTLQRTEYRLPSGAWVDWELIPEFLPNGDVTTIVTSARDITDLKKAEQRLRDSLEEKEVMLREIHHRVKNNLQVIIALMGLQAETRTDPIMKGMLAELQSRARTMSLVHETLYQSQNIARVNLAVYVRNLTANVMQTFGINSVVRLQVHAEEVFAGIDAAIPCGLIINELVTNALKYAFPHARRDALMQVQPADDCVIDVSVCTRDTNLEIIVADNGVGLPDGFDWRKAKSLGLRLVNILAKNQLRGTIEVNTAHGTIFTIAFCEHHLNKEKTHITSHNAETDETAAHTSR